MGMSWRIAGVAMVGAAAAALLAAAGPKPVGPARYTADGKMEFPADYRTWVYLSSGMDMSYNEAGMNMGPDQHMFDNVFVDRAAYEVYAKTGTWPDGTVFVLEIRNASGKGSINKKGQFQTNRLAAEVHVKDTKRFKSGWAFFPFRTEQPAAAFPQDSDCNSCHEKHGAVDTTFVQFYPTLMPIAEQKKTLSAAYLAEKVAVK